MRPIEATELWSLDEYETVRPEFRRQIIALKERRRVDVGPLVTFLFMNRDLVRSQVMEMVRIERIVDPEAVAHELMTYNGLLPGPGELSAVILIAAVGVEQIRDTLDRLVGLNEHVALLLDDETIPGVFDPAQFEDDRISAVQYVRFRLTPVQAGRLRAGAAVHVAIRHANYTHTAALTPQVQAALQEDLSLPSAPSTLSFSPMARV